MHAALTKLSMAAGGLLAIVSVCLMLWGGVPPHVAAFRGIVVMCVGSAVVALFLRFVASLLYRFVAEEVARRNAEAVRDQQNERKSVRPGLTAAQVGK